MPEAGKRKAKGMDKFVSAGYIETIAEMKNISAAAEKLDMSQPALSARLKKTEEQLGTAIFDRSRQPLELTEAGKVYLEYAEKMDALNREFNRHISDLEDMRRGSLTIGGASSFNVSYLPEAVSVFLKKYPGIDIEIIDDNIPEISVKAFNGMIDLFIAHPMEFDERFCYEKLFSERIYVCVPRDWEINDALKEKEIQPETIMRGREAGAAQETSELIDLTVLKYMPFVMLRDDQHIGLLMNELFERCGFEPIRKVCVEQTMTSYALTLAGVGISLMTESCIRNSRFSQFPRFYLTEPELCARDIYVVYPANRYMSRAAKEFIEVLKKTLI